MTLVEPRQRSFGLAILLIVGGLIGWLSAFALTLDKIAVLKDSDAELDCNFSLLVQCGKNLGSWQGSLLGFPNPLIGLGGFAAPIAVGVALLAGASFARWFWVTFNVGMLGAWLFCHWLAFESIFDLGTLCPYCMIVWTVTIAMFWALTLSNLARGTIPAPPRLKALASTLYEYVALVIFANYLLIALAAQVRLDVIGYLF